ncbi:MAG: hypothetical protein Q7P63_15460 [Verrucomicrobiota bacterium JB022]|nr:hypothetical protein [Verrucomicrobiota bacterium JB022]
MRHIPIRLQLFLGAGCMLISLGAAGALAKLVYHHVHGTIESSFAERLLIAGSITEAALDPQLHQAVTVEVTQKGEIAPESPLAVDYSHAVKLFRELQSRMDATYLYTFELREGEEIVYLFDGSVGENFSPAGTVDELPEGMRALLREGLPDPVMAQAREWEQWGLIKTAFFPFPQETAPEGFAFVGADMTMDRIEQEASAAAVASLAGASLSILGAVLLSLFVARWLTAPLQPLRSFALGIAGGQLEMAPPVLRIREFRALAQRVDAIRERLQALRRDQQLTVDPAPQPAAVLLPTEESPPPAMPPSTGATGRLYHALRSQAPWCRLTERQRLILLGLAEETALEAGAILLREGLLPRAVFLVLDDQGRLSALGWQEATLNRPSKTDTRLLASALETFQIRRSDWQLYVALAGGLIADLALRREEATPCD